MRTEYLITHNPRQLKRCLQRLFKQGLITQAIRIKDCNHYMLDDASTIKKTHCISVRLHMDQDNKGKVESILVNMVGMVSLV